MQWMNFHLSGVSYSYQLANWQKKLLNYLIEHTVALIQQVEYVE